MPEPITNLPLPSPRRKTSRRQFLLRGSLLGGGGLIYANKVEPNRIRIDRVEVPLVNLPPQLEGLTICQLSDLHRGPVVSVAKIRHAVDVALSLQPDLIALTGDYVSISARYIDSCVPDLSRLQAKHGVFAVLGNHDYWTDRVGAIVEALTSAGARVLVNAHAVVEVAGVPLCLLGLDDVWAGHPDLDQTLERAPRSAFKVLLAHEPDFADETSRHNIPLQLSGHSHGGQVRLPGLGALILPKHGRKYPIGLQRVQNVRGIRRTQTLVYTNRGIGTTASCPFRVNCPPEVTLLTLRGSVAKWLVG